MSLGINSSVFDSRNQHFQKMTFFQWTWGHFTVNFRTPLNLAASPLTLEHSPWQRIWYGTLKSLFVGIICTL